VAAAHPTAAQLNVYGERHPAVLCPANPDARRYVVALARDLAERQGVDGIELEPAHFFGWLHHSHPKLGTPMGAAGELLLSLCVCPHCLAAGAEAGADADAVVRFAEDELDRLAATEMPGAVSLGNLRERSPALDAYLAARRATVTGLLREVRQAVRVPLFYFAPADDGVTGIDWPGVSVLADVLELPAYVPSAVRARGLLRDRVRQTGLAMERWTVGLSADSPECTSSQQLIETAEAVLQDGVAGIAFYNYGLIPPARLGWVREAARQATTRPGTE